MPDGQTGSTTLMGDNQGTVTPDAGTTPAAGTQTPASPPAWMAQLPDDLKSHADLTQFSKLGDLGKTYLELKGKLEGTVKVPGENATPEEKTSFYKALGRPDTPEGYELNRPALPPDIIYDENQEKMFRKFAHDNGLSGQQAKAVFDLYHEQVLESVKVFNETAERARTEAETTLKKEWGEKFNGNLETAKRALKEFGGDEVVNFMNKSGLGNIPLIIKLFQKIGDAMSEDKFKAGSLEASGDRPRSASGLPMLDFPSMRPKT